MAATFSPQMLQDCVSRPDGLEPTVNDAYEYIKYVGAIPTLVDYPLGFSKGKCYFNYSMEYGVSIQAETATARLLADDEDTLQRALYSKGPVTATFKVLPDFMSYSSGIYASTKCQTQEAHSIDLLVVGYDT